MANDNDDKDFDFAAVNGLIFDVGPIPPDDGRDQQFRDAMDDILLHVIDQATAAGLALNYFSLGVRLKMVASAVRCALELYKEHQDGKV